MQQRMFQEGGSHSRALNTCVGMVDHIDVKIIGPVTHVACDMQALEEAGRSMQAQLEECGRERDRRTADGAAQLRAASDAQAAAQKALAATEAEFRVAVQARPHGRTSWWYFILGAVFQSR